MQEDEATKLMVDAFPVNSIDLEEYPKTGDLQNRCVSIISRLFNIPETGDGSIPMGGSSVGSSEAIMLATLAMKKSWVAKRKAAGKDFSNPNIVMSSAVQVCWEKAARYFDVEEKYVYCTDERYVIDPKLAIEACDENTIGICAILGVTYTGHYEDVKAINDLLVEKNMDVPIHGKTASSVISSLSSPGISRCRFRRFRCSIRQPQAGMGLPSSQSRQHQCVRTQVWSRKSSRMTLKFQSC